ncbi:hypothetical protein C0Q70_19623 [Pomacea canaliculata]|uniref:Protein preY, mitochondrial n=2 Tax=Pomacea canaliculata TaxID=400727 RepID=A0A2T7NJU8_POMCA|nr:hypothetical protein C0Q70_19623 [Pomacea canaliculata]
MQRLFALRAHQYRAMSKSQNQHNPEDASDKSSSAVQFDESMLQHLVCPLSKKNLRYDKQNNELVCDALGVAYPVINGIPNLVPEDARMLKSHSEKGDES